ncbi:MAG: TRAP transporter large permease subunit [Alphaproteobacteria bacterium]
MFLVTCGVLMAGFPVAFTLGGVSLAFGLFGWIVGLFDMAFVANLPSRVFGTMTNQVLFAVPLFVFMGVMLERSRIAEELLDTMGKAFGRMRGGLGFSVTIVGALLAASTGIVGATVVTMGLLALPTMLKRGYSPTLACGSIAAAGTLGQIIPPSIVLVLLGDQISNAYQEAQREIGNWSPEPVSVGDLFAGALLPGLVLVGLYLGYQVLMAIVAPKTSPAMPRDAVHDANFGAKVMRALVPPLLLIVAVLGSILGGVATPTEAAGVGAVGALMLAAHRQANGARWLVLMAGFSLIALLVLTSFVDLRVTREEIPTGDLIGIVVAAVLSVMLVVGLLAALWTTARTDILKRVCLSTMEITAMVFVILIGAGLFSLVFRGYGGDHAVTRLLTDEDLLGGPVGAIVVVMVVMFVLGFFLDFIEIVFVVVPVVAPALLANDFIDPVWLGVLMAVNLQTSFLTPPFGFALFYLRGVAPPQVKTMQIYRGVLPFILMQILALGIMALFPGLATWLPDQLFG